MEEILASIRRIISEDETPGAEGETAAEAESADEPEAVAEPEVEEEPVAAAPEPEPEPELEVAAEEDDDVLELTEPVAAQAADHSIGDLDVFPSSAPEPMPMPAQTAPMMDEDSLVGAPAAAAAVSAFGQLATRVGMPPASQTLDEVVRELLRPLLKEWLDQNLAGIVQAKVDEEVERLARRRGV